MSNTVDSDSIYFAKAIINSVYMPWAWTNCDYTLFSYQRSALLWVHYELLIYSMRVFWQNVYNTLVSWKFLGSADSSYRWLQLITGDLWLWVVLKAKLSVCEHVDVQMTRIYMQMTRIYIAGICPSQTLELPEPLELFRSRVLELFLQVHVL